MLDINISSNGNETLIVLKGSLNVNTSSELQTKMEGILSGVENLIFDMKDLEYISSAGLRVLIYVRQTLDSNANMVLKNVSDSVKDVFEVTGLIEMFNIE